MKINKKPTPVLSRENLFIMLFITKNNERNPKIAKIFEKKTIYGSCVTENIAGIESTAKMMSENSITKRTKNKEVINHFPFCLMKKSCPQYSFANLKYLEANFTTGWFFVSISSSFSLENNILNPEMSAFTGGNSGRRIAEDVGDISDQFTGFKVMTHSYLFQLVWNDSIANIFYTNYYTIFTLRYMKLYRVT